MTDRGQEIYDKMMLYIEKVKPSDPYFLQKRWLYNHIAMLCRLYEVGKNTALAMGLSEMGFLFPFICDKHTKYVLITIEYKDVNYMVVDFGVIKITVRTTYSNLIDVIEIIEDITENQFYQDESAWSHTVGSVFSYLELNGVIAAYERKGV